MTEKGKTVTEALVRVAIVEDHEMYRRGLCAQFDTDRGFEVVAEFGTASEAVRTIPDVKPSVTLMDLQLPWQPGATATYCGAEAIRQIRQSWPEARIAVITMHSDIEHVRQAIQAGASTYILKDGPANEMIPKVRMTAQGEAVLDQKVASMLARLIAEAPTVPTQFVQLTPRENQILLMAADGSNKHQIARALAISSKTVDNMLSNILPKLNVDSREKAIDLARAARLSQDTEARVPREAG